MFAGVQSEDNLPSTMQSSLILIPLNEISVPKVEMGYLHHYANGINMKYLFKEIHDGFKQ